MLQTPTGARIQYGPMESLTKGSNMPVFADGVVAYDPQNFNGIQKPDPSYSGIKDCGVWANSNEGAGLLGSCNTGYGAAGLAGDPAATAKPLKAGVLGSSTLDPGVVGV